MSRRRLENLFKRKFPFLKVRLVSEGNSEQREWAKRQFKDFSRLGGSLIVMRMGG